METTILVLLILNLLVVFGLFGFLYKVYSELKADNKQLKSSLKDFFQKSENDNRILRKELTSIGSKIGELTEVEKME
jgi:hypothetical protein